MRAAATPVVAAMGGALIVGGIVLTLERPKPEAA